MANTVVATGPDSDWDRDEEIPVWFVGIQDDDGEDVGKVWKCYSREKAQKLMQDIARDRRLPFLDETDRA